jgi:hypothetical protein
MSDLNEIEKGQLCQSTIESLYEATGGLKYFPGLLKKIITNKAWESRFSKGKLIELPNLRALITEKPVRGWGEDPKNVESVIKHDAEALSMYREAMVEKPGKRAKANSYITNNVSNKQEPDAGNSRAYSIDRVKREAPELAADVLSGKMSPNAALVKAGIRENRQIYIPREPKAAAEKLKEAFGEAFISKLIKYLNT